MKINEQWLREWVNPGVDLETIVAQLTMAGLEVDGVESTAAQFSGVVVGHITAIAPHPDAAKLRICQVSDGAAQVQVVCGAPNAAVGMKAPFARPGAELPGGLAISSARLRGVESHGMLCGGPELKLNDDDSGLLVLPDDAPAGAPLEHYLGLADRVVELDITPNRGDCFSVLGIAREVGVINRTPLTPPAFAPVAAVIDDVVPVTIEAPEACPRYCARVVRGVDPACPTPVWMQEKLRRCGLRPINLVVDITNYVMLELGQPMHAFDLATIAGGIVVRQSREGETLTLLDGQQLSLDAQTLVIADAARARAVAGIMGGEDSGVSAGTVDILFESAFFTPALLAGKARRYGLHTDSSHRFERGVDHGAQRRAIERATALLLSICDARPGPVIECVDATRLPAATGIVLRRERIERTLGLDLAAAEVESILQGLGCEVAASGADADGWRVAPPPWRFDMAIEADVLEELARIYGYNRLPTRSISAPVELKPKSELRLELPALRGVLLARGYQEAITYSFVAPEVQRLFVPGGDALRLVNPISADMSEMRQGLWPGLVSAVAYNLNRQQQRVRLFESGLRFIREGDDIRQVPMLAAAITGRRHAECWSATGESVDFFDLKGDLQALLALAGGGDAYRFEAAAHPALHDGQSARLCKGDREIGWLGRLHPRAQQALGLAQDVFLMEVALAPLLEARPPQFSELSRFPEVRRDIAVVVAQALPAQAVLDCVREAAGALLTGVTLFDAYEGKGIDKQRKSLGLGLTFRDRSRTLNDTDVNEIVGRVVSALAAQFGASLRN